MKDERSDKKSRIGEALFSEGYVDSTAIAKIVEEEQNEQEMEPLKDFSSEFYKEQLKKGTQHETEHTTMDLQEAARIAEDHLKENIFYYVDIAEMESEVELRNKVLCFIRRNPDYTDEDFRIFCEGMGEDSWKIKEKMPKWLALLASVYDYTRKAQEQAKTAPAAMSESNEQIASKIQADMHYAMFGEYPSAFFAEGSCPQGYHSVTNSKGTTFCRKSRGRKAKESNPKNRSDEKQKYKDAAELIKQDPSLAKIPRIANNAKKWEEQEAKKETKSDKKSSGSNKGGEKKYKPSKAPAGIQEKRRKEKSLYTDGVSELKGEKNQQKRFKLIESYDMDKINAMIKHMKLPSDGSKTKKIDRIMLELDKKLDKEHRYFDE